MESSQSQSLLKLVMKMLKELNYSEDNWNEECLKEILVTAGHQRTHLITWILNSYMGMEFTWQEQNSFDYSVKKRIIEELSSCGICKPQDSTLVDGTANVEQQLYFWKGFLEYCLKIKSCKMRNLCRKNSTLLTGIITSPYLLTSMEEKDFELLPKDVMKQYKKWDVDREWNDSLISKEEEVSRLEKETSLKCTQESMFQSPEALMESIKKLAKSSEPFLKTHQSYLVPRYKSSDGEFEVDNELGNVASSSDHQLSSYLQHIQTSKEVDSELLQRTDEIQRVKKIRFPASNILTSISSSLD